MPDSVDRRPMRLGTRSCAECRRRKIKCIFPAADLPCQQCSMRAISCTAQQNPEPNVESPPSLSSHNEERLKQQLTEIEGNVRDIWTRLSQTNHSPSLASSSPQAPVTMRRSEDPNDRPPQSILGVETARPYEATTTDDSVGLQDAPLLTLISRSSMTVEAQSPSSEPPGSGPTGGFHHLPQSSSLQDDDLVTLLAATEQYWPIWPPWQYGTLPSSMRTFQTGGVIFAACFLSQMARSSSRCIAAKALLWLSLCVQQAPKTLHLKQCNTSLEALLASYMRTAENLLSSMSDKDEALHKVEAQLMQQRLYLNMGRPRQAWLSLRRAADEAILLRLHRSSRRGPAEGDAGDRGAAIWNEIRQLEVNLALILGLPITLPSSTARSSYVSPFSMLHNRMVDLAAAVVVRNQSEQPDYLATVNIGQELDQCQAIMPDSWWNESPRLDQPFLQVYFQQATKVQYFVIAKLLHLPSMLSPDPLHNYSRASAIAASRGLISAYLGLRSCDRGLFVVCESLEFQAFSAGITLLVRLLLHASGKMAIEDDIDTSDDWTLIESLTAVLRRTAYLMECSVASQAAEVLGLLTQAAQRVYTGPQIYNAILPYFGKITITLSQGQNTAGAGGRGECDQPQQEQQDRWTSVPYYSTTVDISTNLSDSAHFAGNLEGELGGDWSYMDNVDMSFDWTQTFTFDNIDANTGSRI